MPVTIAFSDRKDWEPSIRRGLRHRDYRLVFAEFDEQSMEGADVLFPITIRDVLAASAAHNDSRKGFFPRRETVELAENKRRFNAFLSSHGFADLLPGDAGPDHGFPYVLKGIYGEFGNTTYIIDSNHDEQEHAEKLASDEYFIQEYIPGRDEFTVHFLFDGGEFRFLKQVRYLYDRDLFVKGRGTPATDLIWSDEVDYADGLKRILRQLGYQGIGCFNYKIQHGRPKLFELNARIGGSLMHSIDEVLSVYLQSLRERFGNLGV